MANDGLGVRIHVCGPEAAVESFVLDLAGEPPPLARIERIEREPAPTLPPDSGFHIAASTASAVRTGVVPDAAASPDCVAELFDPFARRYRYPFTNCTHCGPRFSIIEESPYDRAHTSMKKFKMCPACQKEYDDPADRRFHAQPNACPACGPALALVVTGLSARVEPEAPDTPTDTAEAEEAADIMEAGEAGEVAAHLGISQ